MKIAVFQKIILEYFKANGRSFPWRSTTDPYHILVSEIMLQQTQTERVVHKYKVFLTEYPTIQKLAKSPTQDVLKDWQGMGYNRRALYLKQDAQIMVNKYNGIVPNSIEALDALPGVGHATACAVCAYAFNKPVVFIETNIRSVFIHFFFKESTVVSDNDLMPFIEKSLDRSNPRQWYSALMDYGAFLKKTEPNPSKKSKHYVKQSSFEGSNRQLRGNILKLNLQNPKITIKTIGNVLHQKKDVVKKVYDKLKGEGLI